MKFIRVKPLSSEIRRYASTRVLDEGTYAITRRRPRGEWQAWSFFSLRMLDQTGSFGWYGVPSAEPYRFAPNSYRTFRAARAACEEHQKAAAAE